MKDDFNFDDMNFDFDLDLDEPKKRKKKDADPLANVKYKGNLADDAHAEISAVKAAFVERAKKEKERYEIATDSEYWCCLCFQTRAQKEEFLNKSGIIKHGDKYIDGREAAKTLGIEIETPDPQYGKVKIDQKLADWFETI
jgi:ribonuclease HI